MSASMKISIDCEIIYKLNEKKILKYNIEMVKLEDYTTTELKKMISSFNKLVKFSGYSKKKKAELITMIRTHPKINVEEGVNAVKLSIKTDENFEKQTKVKKEKVKKEVKKEVEKLDDVKVVVDKKAVPKKEEQPLSPQDIKKILNEFDESYITVHIEKNKLDDQDMEEALKEADEQLEKDLKRDGISILEDYIDDDEYKKTKNYFEKNKKPNESFKDFYNKIIKPVPKKEEPDLLTLMDKFNKKYNAVEIKKQNLNKSNLKDFTEPYFKELEKIEKELENMDDSIEFFKTNKKISSGFVDIRKNFIRRVKAQMKVKKEEPEKKKEEPKNEQELYREQKKELDEKTLNMILKEDKDILLKPSEVDDPKQTKKIKKLYKKVFETYKKSYGDLLDKYDFSKSNYRKDASNNFNLFIRRARQQPKKE